MKNGNGKNPIQNIGVGRNGNLTPGNPGNSGGKPGRSGRKSNIFIERCHELADTEVLDAVVAYFAKAKKHRANPLTGPADPAWRWCAEYVSQYCKSKAPQKQEVSGGDAPIRFELDLQAASLARLTE